MIDKYESLLEKQLNDVLWTDFNICHIDDALVPNTFIIEDIVGAIMVCQCEAFTRLVLRYSQSQFPVLCLAHNGFGEADVRNHLQCPYWFDQFFGREVMSLFLVNPIAGSIVSQTGCARHALRFAASRASPLGNVCQEDATRASRSVARQCIR